MTDSDRKLQTVLLLAGAVGLVVPFVPFTYDVVPFTDVLLDAAVDDSLWQMAVPTIVLPLPILAVQVVRFLKRDLAPWVDATSYALALAAMFIFMIGAAENMEIDDYAGVWSGVVLLAGITFGVGLWLSRRPGDAAVPGDGLLVLQVAYLVPTTFWIAFAFSDNVQLGAWLAVIAVFAYGLQIVANATRRGRTLLLLLPVLALFGLMLAAD